MKTGLALVTIALLALPAPLARAFEGEVHEAITREALRSLGYRDSAAALVVAGNLATDKDEFNDPAAHFDDEAFEAGSRRLREKIGAAVEAVLRCDRPAALENIGRALHATQDFFAHSNFVERGDRLEDLDLLEMRNPAPGTACRPPRFLGPLTSGYWPDDQRPSPEKCIHAELNKDAPLAVPRFARARALALNESLLIVRLVESRVRARFPERAEADAAVDFLRLGPIALEGTTLACPTLKPTRPSEAQASCEPPAPAAAGLAGLAPLLRLR